MGILSDKANQQSKFLILNKGEHAIVQFIDFRFVPSQKDPTVEVVMYRLNQDGKEKFWTNGSSKIMRFMDEVKQRTWLRISRKKWLNKDGSEDKGKSAYSVDELNDRGEIIRPFEYITDSIKETSPAEERVEDGKGWDDK